MSEATTLADRELKYEIGDQEIEYATKDICLHLSPGDVFLDIGSHQGSWSARALAQGVDVIMIDKCHTPTDLIEFMKKSGRDGKIDARVLMIGDGSRGSTTIDSLNLPRVDFVKIDVEGDELAAIRGMAETIRRCRPRIMTEVHRCYGVSLEAATAAINDCTHGYVHTVIGEQPDWYWHLLSEPR